MQGRVAGQAEGVAGGQGQEGGDGWGDGDGWDDDFDASPAYPTLTAYDRNGVKVPGPAGSHARDGREGVDGIGWGKSKAPPVPMYETGGRRWVT